MRILSTHIMLTTNTLIIFVLTLRIILGNSCSITKVKFPFRPTGYGTPVVLGLDQSSPDQEDFEVGIKFEKVELQQ